MTHLGNQKLCRLSIEFRATSKLCGSFQHWPSRLCTWKTLHVKKDFRVTWSIASIKSKADSSYIPKIYDPIRLTRLAVSSTCHQELKKIDSQTAHAGCIRRRSTTARAILYTCPGLQNDRSCKYHHHRKLVIRSAMDCKVVLLGQESTGMPFRPMISSLAWLWKIHNWCASWFSVIVCMWDHVGEMWICLPVDWALRVLQHTLYVWVWLAALVEKSWDLPDFALS